MSGPRDYERRSDSHDIATRVALVEQSNIGIAATVGRLESKIDNIGERVERAAERVEARLESASSTPAGRELLSRFSTVDAAGVARDSVAKDHEERIADLEEWRSEARGVVRFLGLLTGIASGTTAIVTLLHLFHIAGW